jgi:hypothetical protein
MPENKIVERASKANVTKNGRAEGESSFSIVRPSFWNFTGIVLAQNFPKAYLRSQTKRNNPSGKPEVKQNQAETDNNRLLLSNSQTKPQLQFGM